MHRVAILLVSVLSMCLAVAARAQTPLATAFTYQGELASGGTAVTGAYDVRFRLFDAGTGGNQIGSTLCSDNLAIAAGRFTVSLDFGAAFAGQKRFLEIEVRPDTGLDCSNASGYTTLGPRQELTAAPNATFAQNAGSATTAANAMSLNGQSAGFYQNAANLTGTIADARLSSNVARLDGTQTFTGQTDFSNPANTFSGIFTGSGAGLTNLSGGSISAGTLERSSLSADVRSGVGTVGCDLSVAGSVATGAYPRCVAVSGSFAYVVNHGSDTLQVFNISNPAAPTPVGSVATESGPYSVAVSGSFAYVVNLNSSTLQVFNIGNPAAPTPVGSVAVATNPYSVAVSGSFAYVVSFTSAVLQVFNISNPAAPTLAGSVATGSYPQSVAVSGSFAYVVSYGSNSLQVFNINDSAAPTLVGSVATGGNPYSVAVSGSFAYVVNYNASTLQVFNINDSAAPTLVGSVATGDEPYSVAVSGSFACVVNIQSNTLQLFNISDSAAPTLAGSVSTVFGPVSVTVSGSFAYVVSYGSDTLQVFNAALGVSFGTPLLSSSLAGVSGSGLTGVNAASLNGQAASFYTNASNITTGTLSTAQVPNLDASKITTGTLADARLSSNIPRLNTDNTFTSTRNSFAGRVGVNTPPGVLELDVNGRVNVAQGVIQKGLPGGVVTATSDLGLYSQISGSWIRFVTNNAQFAWFTDSGAGTTPRMTLSPIGNLSVTGSLSKGGGSFKIDHPLDPESKYLYHSFVESPDMMNVYNGNVTTDANGYATITLPEYFEALNRDFRYQLTVVDENAPDVHFVRVGSKVGAVSPNQFMIKSTPGNLEISWQVTGIRKDAWAEKNRIPNSVDKVGAEKGKYLHPEAFDKPASKGISSSPDPISQSESK